MPGAVTNVAQTSSKVTEVRFWAVGEVTRVAIQVSGEFKYKTDHLHDPERLFFDIQGARPGMVNRGGHTSPGRGRKRIKQKSGSPGAASLGVTRVVLDLDRASLDVTASQLSNPERLMVELRSKGQSGNSAAGQRQWK